jgi:mannose-6-phosphate isomerase|tara:strand:+ start:199 stop:576 length:378 start_codon:yes stop_codon:yes gene_type:complete
MTMLDTWWKSLPDPEQERPWGEYEILLDDDKVKVKRIRVKPNKRLSYQYHNKRREQWIVVKGNLTIVLDDEKVFRGPGESIHIPLGAKHRAWNETDEDIVFIEVQTGTYFGEDDIVRLEDDFDRI